MAYSNWGAFVYRNGERQRDKEDVGVFDTDEAKYPSAYRIFANIMKQRQTGNEEWVNHSHHAVLGSDLVRLCGYKSDPELWVTNLDGSVEKRELPTDNDGESDVQVGEVEVDKRIWKWEFTQFDGNMLDLKLIEPDGTVWTSRCGYLYGAGHMMEV